MKYFHRIYASTYPETMANLMESYEQQYSSLTAEIVAKTGRIPNLSGGEKQGVICNVERLLDESKELLEQMELEVRGMEPKDRQKFGTRLRSYKAELNNLERDLKKSRIALRDDIRSREELLGLSDSGQASDQRAHLLENSERMERTGKVLEHGYKTCIDSEQIGTGILEDLHSQRETLQRSRERLRETNEGLGKSSRVLSAMYTRLIQNKILLVILAVVMVVVIGIAIYFATKKHSS